MNYTALNIPEVILMEPKVLGDHRGFFMETFREIEFHKQAGPVSFVQDNHSKSGKGILRGLHYQVKNTQGKLVKVISGQVFDVAVDIRKSSPYFGQWAGAILSEENKRMLWIPPGFAHGFYVIGKEAQFTYKCTDYYAPEHERVIVWNDPNINIDWPIPSGDIPVLSSKDQNGSLLKDAEVFK